MDCSCDDVKEYAVRMEYHYENEDNEHEIKLGSGVIVKPKTNSKFCYIFTAKHTFKKSDDSIVSEDEIDCKDIYIYDYHGDKLVCHSLKVNEDHDLVILFLSVEKNKLTIDPIKILNDDKFQYSIIPGYPNIRNEADSKFEYYQCTYDKTNDDLDNSFFEVRSNKPLESYGKRGHSNIKGLSGSGVFTKGTEGKYYLVGIQLAIENIIHLSCLDLREIIDEINNSLPEKIGVEGYSFSEAIGIDPDLVDFDRIKAELKNNLINQIKNTEPDERLKYLKDKNSEWNRKLRKFDKDITSNIKEIADTYLYRSILFHENNENKRATHNFKKAVKFDPSYETYFATAKLDRERRAKNTKNLLIDDKKSLDAQEKLYKKAVELEEDNNSKLKQLRYLHLILLDKLKLVSEKPAKQEIYDNFINIYLSMLNICSHEDKNTLNELKQAQILYNLALVYIFKEEHDIAKSFLKESSKLSGDNTSLKTKAINLYNNLSKAK